MSNDPQDLLNQKVQLIEKLIAEAESIADEHELSFSLYPEYGMGGTYDGEEKQWYPSSQSC